MGKNIESILTDISNDAKNTLKYKRYGFREVLIIGAEDKYKTFIKFFNKKTNYYYSKRIQYSSGKINIEEIAKDIYPILIDKFL
ncbi:MAG: hypothetical protein AABX61_01070 [Nanoarchaeota archaeon]